MTSKLARAVVRAPETVYDALMIPALNYAELDRLEERLTPEEETSVFVATRELMADAAGLVRSVGAEQQDPEQPRTLPALRATVFGYPASSPGDELALRMLKQLLDDELISLEIASNQVLASEMIAHVRERGCSMVCIADLPPSVPSKTRYLVKKLRSALPHVKIVVGRWAPPSLADEDFTLLMNAGATAVASTLVETSESVRQLARLLSPTPVQPSSDAA